MSSYLITGVTGFVGRYFVEYLQAHEPIATIYGVDRASLCDMSIDYRSMDLNDKNAVAQMIEKLKPDYLLHLASMSSVGQSWQDPSSCFKNNTGIMLNILEAVVQLGLKTRILSIGSSDEYGIVSENEMPIAETHVLHPQNPYAIAKMSQEMLCQMYADSLGVDVVMTRSFNHIGPHQSNRFVVPSFIEQLVAIKQGKQDKLMVGDIDVARDFLDVRDVVKAYYTLLHKGKKGEVYNVCSGKAITLRSIIEQTEQILGVKAKIEVDTARLRPSDIKIIVGDNAKITTEIGWKNKIDISETLTDMSKYFSK